MVYRNAKDFSNQHGYRDVMGPVICAQVNAESCILDGEMVTWNKVKNSYGAYGTSRTAGLRQARAADTASLATFSQSVEKYEDAESLDVPLEQLNSEEESLCYVIFDILYLNGEIVMNKTLNERRKLIARIVTPVEHVLEISEVYEEAKTTEEVMERLEHVLDRGLEGLVLKNLESAYQPNERHGGWVKLKPEYVEGMTDTLDLLIIGAYYGKGKRRSGRLSQYLLAVAEKPRDPSMEPSVFYAFCKVGTGLAQSEEEKIQEMLKPYWKPYSSNSNVDFLFPWKPSKDDIPDAIIDKPEHSIILEVLAGGIHRNAKYPAGCTLRFPRIKNIRYTKPWQDCCTLNGNFF
jgi:DNA ligase-4